MKKGRTLLSVITVSATLSLSAQHFVNPHSANLYSEESQRLSTEAFHFGSENINTSDQALSLVNGYYLNTPGNVEKIEKWLDHTTVHPFRNRLQMMLANSLVKQGNYTDALNIYNSTSRDIYESLPAEERVEANLYGAVAYIQTGDLDKAESMLSNISGSTSHEPDIYYYTGYVKYAKGDYEEAIRCLTAANQSSDYKSKAPVYIADSYLQLGNTSSALETIQTWQRQFGNSSDLYNESKRIEGEAQFGNKNYTAAISSLESYVSSVSSPTRTSLYKLGMSQMLTSRYADAAKSLSRSASTASDEMAQSAWLNAGKSYIATGNKRQAGIAFQQASNMQADNSISEEAFYNYAMTLHEGAGMGFGEQVTTFEQFLNKYPKSKYADSVSQHLTEIYFTTKNYKAALNSINKIKNPSAEIIDAKQKVLYNLGTQSFANGDYKSAKNYMSQSNSTRANAESVFWKAESEYRLGEYSSAETDYKTYLSKGNNPGNISLAQYALGYINFKNKKYPQALGFFNKYVDSATGNNSLKADAFNRIGDCLFTQRKFDEAENSYRQALTTDKTYGDYSLLQQSIISGLRGDYTTKVNLLNQINETYSTSDYADNALFEKGRAYVLSGDNSKAMDTFNSLIARYPNSVNARKAMNEVAMLHQEGGATDAAISQYAQVIEKYPNTEEAAAALGSLKQIYSSQGKVSEYAAIAKRAGKSLSPSELDEMTENAAVMATANQDYPKAFEYYSKLESQTMSEEVRTRALEGMLDTSILSGDSTACLTAADKILNGNSKIGNDKLSQSRLIRAKGNMKAGNTTQALADYKELASDHVTIHGAQGTVELAQYYFDIKQYSDSERLLDSFIDSGTPYTYWLARAFVLLADVYSKTDRPIEAQEYLLSLKANYTESEEINHMIEERLNALK